MGCHHRATLWVIGALFTLSSAGGCRQAVVIDAPARPSQADGTISGLVRGPEGASPMEGRAVEVVNVATGERQRVFTGTAGGFSVKVKPGEYRVELTLMDGEAIITRPGIIDVNRRDVDAHADFVIGRSRVVRPHNSAPRPDDGLGAAIA